MKQYACFVSLLAVRAEMLKGSCLNQDLPRCFQISLMRGQFRGNVEPEATRRSRAVSLAHRRRPGLPSRCCVSQQRQGCCFYRSHSRRLAGMIRWPAPWPRAPRFLRALSVSFPAAPRPLRNPACPAGLVSEKGGKGILARDSRPFRHKHAAQLLEITRLKSTGVGGGVGTNSWGGSIAPVDTLMACAMSAFSVARYCPSMAVSCAAGGSFPKSDLPLSSSINWRSEMALRKSVF